MTPVMIRLSPRRCLVVWIRDSGVTGGTIKGVEYKLADVAFGPASYDACMDWIASQKTPPIAGEAIREMRNNM